MATTLDTIAVATVDTTDSNTWAIAKITLGSVSAGLVVRWVDANNHIRVVIDATNAYLIKRDAGSDTTVRTTAITYAAGAELQVFAYRDYVQYTYNGALVSSQQITNVTLQTGTKCGLYFGDTDSAIDDFQTWAAGSDGEYAVLDTKSTLKGTAKEGMVVVTFDDGNDTDYTEAYSYMLPLGVAGTSFLVTDNVDSADHLTWAQCAEMYAAGWDFGNHTKTHADLVTLTQEQQETELGAATPAISTHGLTRASNHVAYPWGHRDANTLAAMTATGMLSGRIADTAMFDPATVVLFEMGAGAVTTTSTGVEAWLDTCIKTGKIIVVLLHKIGTDITQAEFRKFINLIVARGYKSGTISQAYAEIIRQQA